MNWMVIFGDGVAWFLAWLFARGVFHKLAAPRYYSQLIHRYPGGAPGNTVLWFIVPVEAVVTVCLLLSRWRPAGLAVAAVLLVFYAGLMARLILSGRGGMDCGCAGADSQLGISWALVLRNGVCAALALLALGAVGGGVTGWISSAVTGLLALFFITVYRASDAIISNAQWMEGEG